MQQPILAVRAAIALLLLAIPTQASAQAPWIKPIPLTMPPPVIGVLQGNAVGSAQRDTGRTVDLPRIPTRGTASWAVEVDTFDMRRKWTLRLRAEGPDHIEVVLRKADSLPPEPTTYDVILLATGISHADPKFLAGEMLFRLDGKPQRVVLGGGYDRATFGKIEGGIVSGAVAVIGGPVDRSDRRPWTVGQRRFRGLEVEFTARGGTAASSPAPQVTDVSEMRIMASALNGVFISWIGAINRDGDIEDRSPAGVRAFVNRRWGAAIAVDSVAVRGDNLWVRLRGRATGATCSQSTSDQMPMCRKAEWSRG